MPQYAYQQYTPPPNNAAMHYGPPPGSYSPTFGSFGGLDTSSATSSASSSLGLSPGLLYLTPYLRYYLSKLFDIEDDLEFCPDIPETSETSPAAKKFNPYTASVFLPTSVQEIYAAGGTSSPLNARPQSPHTPRIKKALDIVNPQTRMRVASSSK